MKRRIWYATDNPAAKNFSVCHGAAYYNAQSIENVRAKHIDAVMLLDAAYSGEPKNSTYCIFIKGVGQAHTKLLPFLGRTRIYDLDKLEE